MMILALWAREELVESLCSWTFSALVLAQDWVPLTLTTCRNSPHAFPRLTSLDLLVTGRGQRVGEKERVEMVDER